MTAYSELNKAACKYFYTLKMLELGTWDEGRIREADKTMTEVAGHLISVLKEHQDEWKTFWQRARVISETVVDSVKDRDSLKNIWRNEYKEFGSFFQKFGESASSILREGASDQLQTISNH
jgi:hypothetical protein